MASTLKTKGFGDDNILGEFHDNYSFPRQLIPETMNGKKNKPVTKRQNKLTWFIRRE
jgi:hypothetical protein